MLAIAMGVDEELSSRWAQAELKWWVDKFEAHQLSRAPIAHVARATTLGRRASERACVRLGVRAPSGAPLRKAARPAPAGGGHKLQRCSSAGTAQHRCQALQCAGGASGQPGRSPERDEAGPASRPLPVLPQAPRHHLIPQRQGPNSGSHGPWDVDATLEGRGSSRLPQSAILAVLIVAGPGVGPLAALQRCCSTLRPAAE